MTRRGLEGSVPEAFQTSAYPGVTEDTLAGKGISVYELKLRFGYNPAVGEAYRGLQEE